MFPFGQIVDLAGLLVPPLPKAKTVAGRRRLLQEMDPFGQYFPETMGVVWRDPLGHNWSYGCEKSEVFSKRAMAVHQKVISENLEQSESELADIKMKINAVARGDPGATTVMGHEALKVLLIEYVIRDKLPTKKQVEAVAKLFDKQLKATHYGVYFFLAELALLWFTHYNSKQMLWHLAMIFGATHIAKRITARTVTGCSVGNYANYGAFVDRFLFRKGQKWLSLASGLSIYGLGSEAHDLYSWFQQKAADWVGHKEHQIGFISGGLLSRFFLK